VDRREEKGEVEEEEEEEDKEPVIAAWGGGKARCRTRCLTPVLVHRDWQLPGTVPPRGVYFMGGARHGQLQRRDGSMEVRVRACVCACLCVCVCVSACAWCCV
jgi:hypothetical protein